MTKKNKTLEYLDFLANHFEPRDWDYTRKSSIKSIRYQPDQDRRNKFSHRVKDSIMWFISPPEFTKMLDRTWQERLRSRFTMPFYLLKRDNNLPDGILDSGNIITFWEETGEYLNLMQPTVGSLLVTFLKEEPEHPHAKLITKELERLHKRFDKRLKDGEVQ